MNQLGVNLVYYDLDKVLENHIGRIEVCLGRHRPYETMHQQILLDIKRANQLSIPVSVHLPILLNDAFPYDYLEAFYLDESEAKRTLSFNLLEENLKCLKAYDIDYCVLHFAGRVEETMATEKFNGILSNALVRLNQLADQYGIRLLVEYFGVNANFFRPDEWIKALSPYSHLGILLDLTHFYFASLKNNFDFYTGLRTMLPHVDAFHLWTTFGDGYYDKNNAYMTYHHIVPNLMQRASDGWIFNTKEIIDLIARTEKPLIIEASPHYLDEAYYHQSILEINHYLKLGKNA